jgi:hypothetical protein
MTKPMSEDERVVRKAWEESAIENRGTPHYPIIYINGVKCQSWERRFAEWDEGWFDAAEYTRNRQREIADVQEEIWFLEGADYPTADMNESVKACAACKRALAREQAALAEKKRGMK